MSKNNQRPSNVDSPYPHQKSIRQDERHILLVDDNLADLSSISSLLKRLEYRVVLAIDPHEALKIFHEQSGVFDLIITDQLMPGMQGNELAALVRKVRKDIPIIVCSGSEEALYELKEQGADIQEYMLKPFSGTQLAEAIKRLVI
jgi:CheY-like chemotaxis protein